MKLYNIKKDTLEEVSPQSFKLERDIQELVEKNITDIFGYLFISSELTVQKYRIDSLCFNEDTNSFVIIEYKKGSSYSVIDQGYTYLQLLLNNKSEFLLTLSQYYNKVLKLDDVDWSYSKVVFISPSFTSYQKDSVNFKNLPFELWEIKKFSNDIITLDQHHSTSKENIELPKDEKNKEVLSTINNENKSVEIDYHLSRTTPEVVDLWNEVSEKILELNDTYLESIPRYITLCLNNKKICYIRLKKKYINVGFIRGRIQKDGTKSKTFFELDDPKDVSKVYTWTYKSGIEGSRYTFNITKNTDLEYVYFLLKQKYQQILNG